jgi:hypothetical protein
VPAGAEIATIALPKPIPYPQPVYDKLNTIPVIRQILIYPPLIFNPPMNKRSGSFERVYVNPLESIDINKEDWLCYPAKVGSLMVMIYFSYKFAELGFALCNLFELSNDKDLYSKPDAAFLFGVPSRIYNVPGTEKTIFYDDAENDMLVGAIPDDDVFGYFGYLKKMTLTLHNIIMMKRGRFPFHGALVNLTVRGKKPLTILTIGDTGAGKSETLEAFRQIGGDEIENITVIADDMGSLFEMPDGRILGYGTETGAFIRLDDLQTGYAFGQIDRTIIMSPDEVNARAILPVTTYSTVIKGFPLDLILYANNYEVVGEENPVIEWFDSCDDALRVFREGYVMSKGTTAKTGMNQSYFANIFGPQQYQQEHDILADKYFTGFFSNGIKVGQLRTQLGIPGLEHSGPELAARALLELAKK